MSSKEKLDNSSIATLDVAASIRRSWYEKARVWIQEYNTEVRKPMTVDVPVDALAGLYEAYMQTYEASFSVLSEKLHNPNAEEALTLANEIEAGEICKGLAYEDQGVVVDALRFYGGASAPSATRPSIDQWPDLDTAKADFTFGQLWVLGSQFADLLSDSQRQVKELLEKGL